MVVPVTPRDRYPAVLSGGPAGFAAAVAAPRAGSKTALVERYGYLGGLWTGGLVLLVYPTHATENGVRTKVVRGVGDELLERIARYPDAATNHAAGKGDPTTDPAIVRRGQGVPAPNGATDRPVAARCDVDWRRPGLSPVSLAGSVGPSCSLGECVAHTDRLDDSGGGTGFAGLVHRRDPVAGPLVCSD